MPELMAAPRGPSGGKNKGGAYVDRDKPSQIRFSNINAAKGTLVMLGVYVVLWRKYIFNRRHVLAIQVQVRSRDSAASLVSHACLNGMMLC